jgi:hypothetical protein
MSRIFQDEYMKRNQLGYEGDTYIGIEIKKLVSQHNIELIVETGTYFGYTTLRLAEIANVITIELQHAHYLEASQTFNENKSDHRIDLIHGDTVQVLTDLCPNLQKNNVLFFLDAHWEKHCPLLDELRIISENKMKPIICIHDFKVPNREDLGYDSYNGQDFTFDWIKSHIENIYGVENYGFHYNNESEGAKRGVIYIYPKD